MRRLDEVVATLAVGSDSGVIYAETPWSAASRATLHDPWSAAEPPPSMAALVDADLAHEYLRVWSSWQGAKPSQEALVEALLDFVARPLPQSKSRVASLALLRVTMQSGRSYDDPDEDLLYQLFLEIESGSQGFLVLERLNDASSQTFVQALRKADGTYLVEERRGGEQTQRSVVVNNMVTAFEAVRVWTLRGTAIRQHPDGLTEGL